MASTSRKKAQKRWLWILPALLAGVLVILGSHWLGSTSAQEPAQKAVPDKPAAQGTGDQQQTQLYTVANEDISRTLLITGELQAFQSTEIKVPATRSSSTSTINYLAPEGEIIKEGQKLIEFDGSALLTQMSEQQRNVDEAGLTIDKAKKDLEAQRCDLLNSVAQAEGNLKIAKLNADIPVELQPKNTYLKYQNDYEKAKLTLQRAQESLANFDASYDSNIKLQELKKSTAELTLKRMEGDLKVLSINAPQDGAVIYGDNWTANRRYQIGDVAFPGMTVVILPDMSSMKVTGYVYDTELQYLAPGMACDVHLDAVPGQAWRGKIESLTSVATRKGFATTQKVFMAVIRLDAVDPKVMKPGMTARAEVTVSMANGVPAIPREYVGVDERSRMFVLKETGPKTPPETAFITTGAFGDHMVQVLSGLNVGDRIIPAQKIAENSR